MKSVFAIIIAVSVAVISRTMSGDIGAGISLLLWACITASLFTSRSGYALAFAVAATITLEGLSTIRFGSHFFLLTLTYICTDILERYVRSIGTSERLAASLILSLGAYIFIMEASKAPVAWISLVVCTTLATLGWTLYTGLAKPSSSYELS